MSTDPRGVYAERLGQRRHAARVARLWQRWIRRARLAVFAAGVALAFAVSRYGTVDVAWLWFPALAFLALLVAHQITGQRRSKAERAVAFYELGLARIEHRFAGLGIAGDHLRPEAHPYADDLDLFGPGSVFEWLCTARTVAGEQALARWLLGPESVDAVRARQVAVAELRDRLELREALALIGEDVRVALHAEVLQRWSKAPPVGLRSFHRWFAAGLSCAAIGTLTGWLASGSPVWRTLFLLTLAAEIALWLGLGRRVRQVLRSIEAPVRELELFSSLLARIESERFESELLRGLRVALQADGVVPSRRIAQLRLLLDLLDMRRSTLFAPIAVLLLWTPQLAAALEAWRLSFGANVPIWLRAVGELEALLALAGNAWEHPDAVVPELVEQAALFEATDLGHPLLPASVRVRNDVRLSAERPLLLVSGSNMSGKSTWLRTIGVAAVLAQAGATVCARRLRISPLSVGASIRIVDSLQGGASHFYAEILRLRAVLDLTEGTAPALFLLDEILHGTNSGERAIGSEAVVRALLERGSIGLVTTHDLALAEIAMRLGERAANVHFADHVEGGRMAFDYRVRPGVVRTRNALQLMREVGLPVAPADRSRELLPSDAADHRAG